MRLGHVIYMRFCIGVFDRDLINYRLGLLRSMSLASLAAQTNSRFDLLVLIDEQMPIDAQRRLRQALSPLPRVWLQPLRLFIDTPSTVRHWVENQHSQRTHRLVSRLDDDDAVSTDAVEKLQEGALSHIAFAPETPAVFGLSSGILYAPEVGFALPEMRSDHAILQSVVAPRNDHDAPYFWHHRQVIDEFAQRGWPSCQIDAAWCYTQHRCSDVGYKKRLARILDHPDTVSVDSHLLSRFAINEELVNQWLECGQQIEPIPREQRRTHELCDIEMKISEAERDGRDVDHLHRRRYKMGARLVRRTEVLRPMGHREASTRSSVS